MGIRVVFVILLAFFLAKDFQKDPKQFIKAKIAHTVALLYLIYLFGTSISYVVYIARKFDAFYDKYHVSAGIISADLSFYSALLNVAICCVIFFFVSGVMGRKNNSRINLIRTLPFVIPTQAIMFYKGVQGNEPIVQDFLVMIVSVVITAIMILVVVWLYSSKMMKDFFNSTAPINETPIQSENL